MILPGVLAQQALLGGGGGGGPPALGDYWAEQGGYYAGEFTIGGTIYYLIDGGIAAESSAKQWKTADTGTPGTAGTTDGAVNTAAIVSAGITAHPAAQHCVSWTGGGFTDWYLPASAELVRLRQTLWSGVAGVPANYSSAGAQRYGQNDSLARYWSSTTNAAVSAYMLNMLGFSGVNTSKTISLPCRPIRRIPK